MSAPDPSRDSSRGAWWIRILSRPRSAVAIVATLFALRMVWQMLSPYTLVEDEAHYWEWSRRLDWSYYSKGPGVAWAIWASSNILGDTEFAVRLPALISSALGMLAAARLGALALQDRVHSALSAILWACVPGLAIAGMLMTIDAPYTACWAWACVFALTALTRDDPKQWVFFGLAIAIGFIFKYTILILLPGVILAGLCVKGNTLRIKWFSLGLAVSALGLVPVALWNADHDWATVRHLMGHLGMRGGDTDGTVGYAESDSWTPLWMIEFLALQFAVGGAVLLLAIFGLINARKHADPQELRSMKALAYMALPMYAMYLCVSLVTQTEGNWAMAGVIPLIPIASFAIIDGVRRADLPVRLAWGASLATGILLLLLFPAAHWASDRRVIGEHIPVSRLTGMREHADHAQRVLDEIRAETGLEPFVMCEHYGRASQLAFYLDSNPITYCPSPLIGGRKTQYDMWTETDLSDTETLEPLRGRPALLMGGRMDQWTIGFERVEEIGKLDGEPVDNRTTYIGYGFRDFSAWIPRNSKDHPLNQPKEPESGATETPVP